MKIKREIIIKDLSIWTNEVIFSFISVNDNKEEKRKWKEKFWMTAENDQEAECLFNKLLEKKKEEFGHFKDFTFKILDKFKKIDEKPSRNFSSVYSLVQKLYKK